MKTPSMINRGVFKIIGSIVSIHAKVKGISNELLSRDKSNQR